MDNSLWFLFQDNQFLYTALEEINTTLVVYQKQNDLKFLNVDSAISNLTQRVALLENYLDAVNKLEKRENSSVSSVSARLSQVPGCHIGV